MASKVSPFALLSRRFSLNYRFYSSSSAARAQNPLEVDPNPSEFDSAIHFLKNKLHPYRLIRVLDSTSDSKSAVSIFKWASRQKNFRQTAETYTHIIRKLGMVGERVEMEDFLKELVRLDSPNAAAEEALGFLIHWFCGNNRAKEALVVFETASLANYKLSLSNCNVLLGYFASEQENFQSVMFVYKEMVKAGILPDVETLNYLIEALCEVGRLDTALDQFHRMSKKRCAPNSRTFEILISALCASNRVNDSVRLFNQMLEIGCCPNLGFYNSIIPLFCRVNRFKEGTELLRIMTARDLSPGLYLYSVLIECLCNNRQVDDAIELFEEMTDWDSRCMDISNGHYNSGKLRTDLNFLEGNFFSEINPCNALLKGYCDANRFREAVSFLAKMTASGSTDNLSWNIIIRGLCESGHVRKAFEVLCRMIVSSCVPDEATYPASVIGYCNLGKYDDAFDKFRRACVNNMSMDSLSCSELIEGLCHVKKIQEAAEVFYYTVGKGCGLISTSINLLIQEMCLSGKLEEAIRLRSLAFHNATDCTSLTYATIMLKLLESNKVNGILPLLSQMLVEGCPLDATTYCLVVRSLCCESIAREAARFFDRMVHGSFVPDPETLETLVHCMAKCSQLHLIMHSLGKVIDEDGLLTPPMCNMVVSALLKEGHKQEACKFLDWMLDKGWVPDADTHSLLVRNISVGERDGAIEVYKDAGADKVSNILAEGLENYDGHIIEE